MAVGLDEWIAQADPICEAAEARAAELPEPTDLASYAVYIRDFRPIFANEVDQVGALELPVGNGRGAIEQMLGLWDQELIVAGELETAATAVDGLAAQGLQDEIRGINSELDGLGRSLGLQHCGVVNAERA